MLLMATTTACSMLLGVWSNMWTLDSAIEPEALPGVSSANGTVVTVASPSWEGLCAVQAIVFRGSLAATVTWIAASAVLLCITSTDLVAR
jgi:hypothetical protein